MQTKVKRRPFGNTGLYVSEVGLGAMNLRMLDTVDQAFEMVNYALDQGINLIDTARAYKGVNGEGVTVESEDIVGRTIAARTDIDEPIVIVTKGHGYTPEAFDEDLDTSLRTLGVKKTDKGLFIGSTEVKIIYFYHGIMRERWESMKKSGAIEHGIKRRDAGDFTYLGFSAHYGDGDVIKEAIDTGVFQVTELPYNLYNRVLSEDGKIDLFRYAHEHGMGIVNMKAFNGTANLATSRILGDMVSITYQDMLRFCLGNPYVSTIDAGARWPSEFQADIDASLMPALTPEERKALAVEADKVSGLFSNICRECTHCMEKFQCPQGIYIPSVLGAHARYAIAEAVGRDSEPYRKAYAALEGPLADACVACGQCKPWCEYHLDIPAMMAKVVEDFG